MSTPSPHPHNPTTDTPAIMVVGTTSDAGKSIVATGLCRLLARRGIRVAPFKAQNMALNSFVTAEGGEMGRSQVTQAYAAGVAPHTDMNPVLLKPMGQDGSQVIVNGHPIGNLKTREYYAMKQQMRAAALAAYDRLAASYETVILEGAGSPAEINLMEEDFVNMRMAAYAGAQTILVADIDRGGVFASIYGTIKLMAPEHAALLAGVVINKFRGDVTQLDSGIKKIEQMTGVPVLGVLPYVYDLRIEDEDSLGLEHRRNDGACVLDIAVIRLPCISNFTDYLAMEHDEGVHVRYIEHADTLHTPDLVILPGTKHTCGDLNWLHSTGIADRLQTLNKAGTPIIGICGGYQMLGACVKDPGGVEGRAGETKGLGLLPSATTLLPRKELAQVEGTVSTALPFAEPETPFHGYEIHAGTTEPTTDPPALAPLTIRKRRGECVAESAGQISEDGLVFGSYVHGIFDDARLRAGLWKWLCTRKGVEADAVTISHIDTNAELDRLADLVEAHVSLNFLEV